MFSANMPMTLSHSVPLFGAHPNSLESDRARSSTLSAYSFAVYVLPEMPQVNGFREEVLASRPYWSLRMKSLTGIESGGSTFGNVSSPPLIARQTCSEQRRKRKAFTYRLGGEEPRCQVRRPWLIAIAIFGVATTKREAKSEAIGTTTATCLALQDAWKATRRHSRTNRKVESTEAVVTDGVWGNWPEVK